MLPKELEKLLVATYLQKGIESLEARAKDQPIREKSEWATETNALNQALDSGFEALGKAEGLTPRETRSKRAIFAAQAAENFEQLIADRNTSLFQELASGLAESQRKIYDVKITAKDVEALALPLMNAEKKLMAADSAMLRGNWAPLEEIKEHIARDLATPYHDFKTVLEKYQRYYLSSKTSVKPGTIADMEVECRVVLEILGNINLAEVNTMESLTRLKTVLLAYPLNKQQRYGDRSIARILKTERNYPVISPKTANEYIARLMAVVDFANKSKLINSANVYRNERFHTDTAVEEQRSAYSTEDIVRLVRALCTQPLWSKNPPRPERYWVILIALFHGLRLGNILALTKFDICQTDKGMWIFRLRHGKTKSTVRPVAICDSLLLLGFLEWVGRLDRTRLFQDTPRTFGVWYNRNEQRNGKQIMGFEARHVTTDPKKCLYSLRHSFAGNVFDLTGDYKITSDMMGHSTGDSVTARYIKMTKAETLKELVEKIHLEHIDLDMLDVRARQLFGHL